MDRQPAVATESANEVVSGQTFATSSAALQVDLADDAEVVKVAIAEAGGDMPIALIPPQVPVEQLTQAETSAAELASTAVENAASLIVPALADQPFEPAALAAPDPASFAPVEVQRVAPIAPEVVPVSAPASAESTSAVPGPVDVSASLEKAGLVMIETSAVQPENAVATPSQQLGRKPRPVVVVPSEPLEIVETKRG
jgi:hypothetical protein